MKEKAALFTQRDLFPFSLIPFPSPLPAPVLGWDENPEDDVGDDGASGKGDERQEDEAEEPGADSEEFAQATADPGNDAPLAAQFLVVSH